ncbi:MAG: guanylate kinase [Lachnospiraceae bacterium]
MSSNAVNQEGLLVVVSGFSGAGKGTAMKRLMEKYSDYALSISATTRKPREGEVNGREYFFKTIEEFKQMIAEDELIEYAQYVENYYGTPRAYVEEQMKAGKSVILEIEIQGALKIKEKFPDAVLLFIVPPSAKVLRERLVGRGTETMEVVEARLQRAAQEAEGVEAYDYVVINDDLETCVDEINEIIHSEKKKVAKNQTLINNIRDELKCFSKGE